MPRTRDISPLCVTCNEAARALRVGPDIVRAWVADGTLASVRWTPTSHPLIPVVELHRFIAERAVRGTDNGGTNG
jgi:hypothetical protein